MLSGYIVITDADSPGNAILSAMPALYLNVLASARLTSLAANSGAFCSANDTGGTGDYVPQIIQTLPLELRRTKWLGIRVLLNSLDKMELEDFLEGGEALLRDFHVRGRRAPYMTWGYLYVDTNRAEESAAVDTIANSGEVSAGPPSSGAQCV